jgi:predicted neuraminidase
MDPELNKYVQACSFETNAGTMAVRPRVSFYRFLAIIMTVVCFDGIHAQDKPANINILEEMVFSEAPFQQCHASTLTELRKGELMAAWFGGSYEGANDVCIWASTKRNDAWSIPRKIVCADIQDTLRYACWNPVLFHPDKKRLILYYKTGPSPREWRGMSVTSRDNGKTWSKPKILEGRIGPVRNKPVVVASGTWLNPSSTETNDRWKVFIERSADQGKTWEVIPIDTGTIARVIQPALLVYPGEKIQALCRSDQNCIMESWSSDDGRHWSPLKKTGILNPNSGIDAITLRSGMQLLVFNPMPGGREWMNGRNRLSVAISRDGAIWTNILDLENKAMGEFSYPAVIQTQDGLIHISYTYNRTTIKHVVLNDRIFQP